jgi:hypothetical protein
MNSNPEFRRQLWLNVSIERLVAAPVVLLLVFALIGVGSDWRREALAVWALCLAAMISGLLGGASAIESLASEARARTWDWQRLSGLGPWKMTWGKLLGSTLYAQYGACIAYAAYLWVGGVRPGDPSPTTIVLLGLATGLLIQSAGMLVAAWQIVSQRPQGSLAASYLLSAGAAGLMLLMLVSNADRFPGDRGTTLSWFSLTLTAPQFWLASAVAFLGWSIFASYRVLRDELQGRSPPWAAMAFAVFLAIYFAGALTRTVGGITVHGTASMRLVNAVMAFAALAYALSLSATMRRVELERWLVAVRHRDASTAWRETPAWIACVALGLAAGIFAATWAGTLSDAPAPTAALCVMLPLIVLRDAALMLALRLRGGPLASDGWLLVFCIGLHGFVPWVAAAIGGDELRQFFSIDASQGWQAAPIIICEILLVTVWLRRLWHASQARRMTAR